MNAFARSVWKRGVRRVACGGGSWRALTARLHKGPGRWWESQWRCPRKLHTAEQSKRSSGSPPDREEDVTPWRVSVMAGFREVNKMLTCTSADDKFNFKLTAPRNSRAYNSGQRHDLIGLTPPGCRLRACQVWAYQKRMFDWTQSDILPSWY